MTRSPPDVSRHLRFTCRHSLTEFSHLEANLLSSSSRLTSKATGIELRPWGAGGFTTVDSVERVTIRHRIIP